MYIFLGILAIGSYLLQPQIIYAKTYITETIEGYFQLKDAIQYQHPEYNLLQLHFLTTKLGLKKHWNILLHILDTRWTYNPDAKVYELNFILEGKQYYHLVKLKRGPNKLFVAKDRNNYDITDIVAKYKDTQGNFSNKYLTPFFLNLEEVNILHDQTKITFKNKEPILF